VRRSGRPKGKDHNHAGKERKKAKTGTDRGIACWGAGDGIEKKADTSRTKKTYAEWREEMLGRTVYEFGIERGRFSSEGAERETAYFKRDATKGLKGKRK